MKKNISLTSVFLLVIFLFGCNQNDNNNNNTTNNETNNSNKTGNTTNKGTNNSNNTGNNNGTTNYNNEEPSPQALKIEDYFPIKANTHYVYQGMGNEYASYDVYVDYTSKGKVQQRIDNGGTVIANIIELKNGKLTKLYSRAEAYYRENLLNSKGEEEILLKEPLEKGTSWKLKNSRVRTITNISTKVTTPSGSYKAIEVTTEGPNDKTIDYYAKNVGLVKSVFIAGESDEDGISSSLSKIEENRPFMQTVNFYYPNINDEKIYYKNKEIRFHTNDLTKKVLETAYKESINNSLSKVFSKSTKINNLYLNKDLNVYIDLNQAFVSEMNAGSGYEAMILQSIVNTFGQYYNVEKVYLTIDNKPYESGHISMRKGEFFKVHVENAIEIK